MRTMFVPIVGFLVCAVFVSSASEVGATEGAFVDNLGQEPERPHQWKHAISAGVAMMSIKQYDRAIAYFSLALERQPKGYAKAEVYLRRGNAYLKKGEREKARADYDRVLAFAPKEAGDYMIRGRVFEKRANYKGAAADYTKALQLEPENPDALNQVAWLRAACPEASMRNGREALRQAAQACALTRWKDFEIIDTLAAAHAEAGDFEQAVKYQEQVIKRTARENRKEMEERLALYQAQKAYRDKLMGAAR